MKKLLLSLFISSQLFAVDKPIIAPTGSVVLKGNSTVKMQTYNTGAWQDRLTILNDGKVGIGTTSPGAKLEISGGMTYTYKQAGSFEGERASFGYLGTVTSPTQVTTGSGLFGSTYLYGGGSYRAQGYIGWEAEQDITSPNQSGFVIANGTGTKRLIIDKDGNVGIGKTPAYKLDVSGSITSSGTISEGTSRTDSYIDFRVNNSSTLMGWELSTNRSTNLNGFNGTSIAPLRVKTGEVINYLLANTYSGGGTGTITIKINYAHYSTPGQTNVVTFTRTAGTSGEIGGSISPHTVLANKVYYLVIETSAINSETYLYPVLVTTKR